MKIHPKYRIAALLVATSFCAHAAHAQTETTTPEPQSQTLRQFLSGEVVPLELKFSDMQSGWSRIIIEREGASTNVPSASNSASADVLMKGLKRYFGADSEAVWTQGQTVELNDEEQLVVYRAQFPSFNETDAYFESRMPTAMSDTRIKPERKFELISPVVRQFLDTVPLRAGLVEVSEIASLRYVESFQFERALGDLESDVRAQMRVSSAQRAQSSRASFQTLAVGLRGYITNYAALPPLDSWEVANKALQPYIKSEIKLAQPDQKIRTNPMLSGKKLVYLKPYASSLVVFYSDADQRGERWINFLDGSVEQASENRWRQIKKASRLP